MRIEDMYQEVILDHYRNPHARGLREPHESEVLHVNPTCGDEITLRVHLDGTTIGDISYDCEGCSISQASASIMTEQLIGVSIDEALKRFDAFEEMITSKGTLEGDEELIGDGVALAGVSQYPARVKCALLGWMAFKDALAQAIGKQSDSGESSHSEKHMLGSSSFSSEAHISQLCSEHKDSEEHNSSHYS